MAGRPIGDRWRQGDVLQGLTVLRAADGCPDQPARSETMQGLSCEIWDRCASGRELRLCLHEGGHLLPEGWVGLAHRWAQGLGAREEGG